MISIIVPCRFRADLTQVCIDSILKYSYRKNYTTKFELILIQEGEDEELTKLLSGYATLENVKFVQNIEPKGYAGALNEGLRHAEGDYYCFMNNDTVATPGWMDEMMKAFEDPEVGLVSPTFWGTGDRQSIEWNDGRQFDYVLNPYCLAGVCFLIKKEVIDKVGAWDSETFSHGGEDIDMTMRISNAGYALVIARRSFIYHYGGASTREVYKDAKVAREKFIENIEKLEKKHGVELKSKFNIK